MKKIFISMVVLTALVWAVPVLADVSFSEKGFGIFFSTGSEKDQVDGKILLTDAMTGEILSPSDGVVNIEHGHIIRGQVFINGAKSERKFEVKWTTMSLVSDRNLRNAEFSSEYGWGFDINPEDYRQSLDSGRCLSVWIRAFGAKKDFIRVIFKITYGKGSVFQTQQIIIKTAVQSEKYDTAGQYDNGSRTAEFESSVKSAIDALAVNQQKIVDKVNEHDSRISNVENWVERAVASQNSTSAGYANLPCVIRLTGNVSNVRLITYDSFKSTRVFTISSGDNHVSLPAGQYSFVITTGNKTSAISNFLVRMGMGPVRINVN